MNATLAARIVMLCDKVLEVVNNNDWPTEEGHDIDNGVICSCPIRQLVVDIQFGLDKEKWV